MELNTLLSKHKNKFINITIIIVALMLANNLHKNSAAELANLKEQEKNEGMKTEIIKTLSRLEARLGQFTASLGKKDSNYIISNINALAKETGVKISSIKPEQESRNADYIKAPFSLTVKSAGYHVIGKFVSKLESSKDVFYVIDTLRMVPGSEGNGLDANLKLTSVAVAN
jgi:Tfp pilus assembly protein PilO